ncbi:hypothetical protein BT67DRAFT_388552, partial [Trichocladium antarcticum]
MPSLATTLPLAASVLAIAKAQQLPPIPISPLITAVDITPTATNIPNACYHVAAQITPRLPRHPTYPDYLQTLANKLGVVSDNCVDVTYAKTEPGKTAPNSNHLFMTWRDDWLNPIINDVRQVWKACHDVPAVMDVLARDQCYGKVIDVVKSEYDNKQKG